MITARTRSFPGVSAVRFSVENRKAHGRHKIFVDIALGCGVGGRSCIELGIVLDVGQGSCGLVSIVLLCAQYVR